MDIKKFKMTKFQLENMVDNPAIVMVAKRGSGKSWICRDIMYSLRKNIPGGMVIAPTDRMNGFYKHFFPDIYIHYEISKDILTRVLSRQALMMQKQKEMKDKNMGNINPRGILVMDDCLSQKGKWAKDQNILEIMMNGRHYNLTFILTMQTPLGITPDLRLNFDYYFLLKEDSQINKKKIYENFASMFQTYAEFSDVFAKCTENNSCMVIDNRSPKNTIEEKVFWFKAQDRKFTFGSSEFKEIHKKYYDPNYQNKHFNNIIKNNNLNKNKVKIDLLE